MKLRRTKKCANFSDHPVLVRPVNSTLAQSTAKAASVAVNCESGSQFRNPQLTWRSWLHCADQSSTSSIHSPVSTQNRRSCLHHQGLPSSGGEGAGPDHIAGTGGYRHSPLRTGTTPSDGGLECQPLNRKSGGRPRCPGDAGDSPRRLPVRENSAPFPSRTGSRPTRFRVRRRQPWRRERGPLQGLRVAVRGTPLPVPRRQVPGTCRPICRNSSRNWIQTETKIRNRVRNSGSRRNAVNSGTKTFRRLPFQRLEQCRPSNLAIADAMVQELYRRVS